MKKSLVKLMAVSSAGLLLGGTLAPVVNAQPASPSASAQKEYTVRYELRDAKGDLVEVLQTESGWTDWSAMELSSVATADTFVEEHGQWNVEALGEGLVYVFTQQAEEEPPATLEFKLEVYRPGAEESFLSAADNYVDAEAAERGFRQYLNTAEAGNDFDWSYDAETRTFTAVQIADPEEDFVFGVIDQNGIVLKDEPFTGTAEEAQDAFDDLYIEMVGQGYYLDRIERNDNTWTLYVTTEKLAEDYVFGVIDQDGTVIKDEAFTGTPEEAQKAFEDLYIEMVGQGYFYDRIERNGNTWTLYVTTEKLAEDYVFGVIDQDGIVLKDEPFTGTEEEAQKAFDDLYIEMVGRGYHYVRTERNGNTWVLHMTTERLPEEDETPAVEDYVFGVIDQDGIVLKDEPFTGTEEEAQKAFEDLYIEMVGQGYHYVRTERNGNTWVLHMTTERLPEFQDPTGPGTGEEEQPGAQDPAQPGQGSQSGTTTDGAKAAAKQQDGEKLPETGEASSTAIFGAAALSILAGLGLVAPSLKKED